jgi:hypothetical protein
LAPKKAAAARLQQEAIGSGFSIPSSQRPQTYWLAALLDVPLASAVQNGVPLVAMASESAEWLRSQASQ